MPCLLLVDPPLRAPTAPALGPAMLRAKVQRDLPGWRVELLDLGLDLVLRALGGGWTDLCERCPRAGLACPRPGLIAGGDGRLAELLRRLPKSPAEHIDHQRAAVLLDALVRSLGCCAAAFIRPYAQGRRGLPVAVRDAWLAPWLERIAAVQPAVVGVSVLGEANLVWALALGRAVREELGLPVLLGGALLAHLDPAELLLACPWIEAVFHGEAEHSLPAWLSRGVRVCEGLPGIAHRRGSAPCVHPPDRGVRLDAIPAPDFSGAPLPDQLIPVPVLPYASSRGCFWGRCTFCSHTLPHGPGVRFRAVERVVEDLREMSRTTGVKHFLFVDEAIPAPRVRRLSRALLDAGLDLRIGLEGIRPEAGFDRETLLLARDAGLVWVYTGVESLDQAALDRVRKGTRVGDIERFLSTCSDLGIVAHASCIVGIPGQGREDVARDLARLRRYPVDAGPFALLHGSAMQRHPERFGLRVGRREILLDGKHGVVRGPRHCFSTREGLQPGEVGAAVATAGGLPSLPPHLGECAAVALAGTGFFKAPPLESAGLVDGVLEDAIAAETDRERATLDRAATLEFREEAARSLDLLRTWEAGGVAAALHAAACLIQLGDFSEALAVLSGLPADLPAAAAQRLRVAMAMGDLRAAGAAVAALHGQGLVDRRSRLALGLCLLEEGDPSKAAAELEIAAALGPCDQQLEELLASVWLSLGRPQQAALALAAAGGDLPPPGR